MTEHRLCSQYEELEYKSESSVRIDIYSTVLRVAFCNGLD